MKSRTLACAVALGLGALPLARRQDPARAGAPLLTPRDSALHALNRLAYGPRPGEVERVAAEGIGRWIEQQLDPDAIGDRALAARVRQFHVLSLNRGDLARVYFDAQRERKLAADGAADTMSAAEPTPPGPKEQAARRLAGQYMDLTVTRATLSERQLFEVMVDFWTNHFNVFIGKGADRFLLPDYIEHTIREHTMGKFRDLLIATAESPAMLFYLDNWQSVAPGSALPRRGEAARTGINENYARELLELHTLGVDGGYTQQDVINVARIFTGWSIERPQRGAAFQFHPWAHDDDEKVVMGVRYPAGGGMDAGIHLLRWLADQPATMHHVSRELCERFVNDEPPDGCVDDAVAAWKRSGGEIREVVRAIVRGPDFWAPANVRAKVKTPLEFVVSALRAVDADPDSTPRLPQVVARLGQPLYMHVAPDGYPEKEESWVNSGALLNRMSAAVALAAGKLPGASVDLDAVIPASTDAERLIDAVNADVLGGVMTDHTKQVIRRQVSDISDPVQARALAVGLAIGGPEFQRQ